MTLLLVTVFYQITTYKYNVYNLQTRTHTNKLLNNVEFPKQMPKALLLVKLPLIIL